MIIRQTMPIDVENFLPHEDDLAEAIAAGVNWKENLMGALGEHTVSLVHNGWVVAIGGNQGDQCWFVTDRCVRYLTNGAKRDFRKAILDYRNKVLKEYPVLWNYVWVGNHNHIRFMESIGATFHQEFTESPRTGERFQLFTITK